MLKEIESIQPKFSSPAVEGNYQVSKWLHFQVLLSKEEMEDLLNLEENLLLYPASDICAIGSPLVEKKSFIEAYGEYLEALKSENPDFTPYRRLFSCYATVSPDCLYSVEVSEKEQLIRPKLPVIQLRPHQMGYSKIDSAIYPMSLGAGAIAWGLQISYPQIFQNPHSQEIVKVGTGDIFPNTAPFKNLSRWMRLKTEPVIFNAHGKRIATPVRIGKEALSLVSSHRQLQALELEVINEDRTSRNRG